MKITEQTIQFCIDTLAAEVAAKYAEAKGVSETEALRSIMATKTYDLLLDEKSFLYLESAEYVVDMLDAEAVGDWKKWQEV
jgi:hypothetical protein